MVSLLPAGLSLHASRLPGRVHEDTGIGLRERFTGYHETLADSADSFGGLPLDALVYGVTGSIYLCDEAAESEVAAQLRAGGAQRVETAAGAIRDVLHEGGARKIALVTPYPRWLTDAAIAWWGSHGISVEGEVGARKSGSIYSIPAEDVIAAVLSLELDSVDAVVLSGTGMPTIEPIERLSSQLEIPLLSSTSCLVRWIVKEVAPDAIIAAHPVVRRLDAWASR